MDDTHTDDSDGDCVVAQHPRGHVSRRSRDALNPAPPRTCCRTLNSMYGYCSGVVDEYSKKKSGRLQHGLCAASRHVAAVAPVRALPVPRLAQAEHVDDGYRGAPEHAADGVALRTVASLVVPAASRLEQSGRAVWGGRGRGEGEGEGRGAGIVSDCHASWLHPPNASAPAYNVQQTPARRRRSYQGM